jgi:hypothetical protein
MLGRRRSSAGAGRHPQTLAPEGRYGADPHARVAGPVRASDVGNLDLFHKMEAYVAWSPDGAA